METATRPSNLCVLESKRRLSNNTFIDPQNILDNIHESLKAHTNELARASDSRKAQFKNATIKAAADELRAALHDEKATRRSAIFKFLGHLTQSTVKADIVHLSSQRHRSSFHQACLLFKDAVTQKIDAQGNKKADNVVNRRLSVLQKFIDWGACLESEIESGALASEDANAEALLSSYRQQLAKYAAKVAKKANDSNTPADILQKVA
jgi:hypothetical protein